MREDSKVELFETMRLRVIKPKRYGLSESV